jgi:1,4-dihydroxy-2-naphthoate octaprenyltransferase
MMFSCFRTAKGIALVAVAVVVGGYFVIWHQQHVAAALPFLVFLACPLLHLFMHGGHGGHGSHQHKTGTDQSEPRRGDER